MRSLIAVITLLISTVAQARDCSESWKNQDLEHVEFHRNLLTNEVKNILVSSYSKIGDNVTDFVVVAYKPFQVSKSETWSIYSRLGAEPLHNAIGDLIAVECSVQSQTATEFSNGLELVSGFTIKRKENNFLVSATKANYSYESSEEIE